MWWEQRDELGEVWQKARLAEYVQKQARSSNRKQGDGAEPEVI